MPDFEALVLPVNWSTGMIERLEFLTDTMTAYDGTESAAKLREFPRRSLEFGIGASASARRRLDSFMWGAGASAFAMPIWTDGMELAADLAAGSSAIPVTTEHRDFAAGAFAFIVLGDGAFEYAEIQSVEPDAVNLVTPTEQAWPAGASVYPGRLCRLPERQGFQRFTGDHVTGRMRVIFTDNSAWPEAAEPTTYRGEPVMTDEPNWVGGIDAEFERKLAQLDYGTGPASFFDESRKPEIVQTMRWLLHSRQRIAEFRSWLYKRAGKFCGLWVPTWVDDMVMASNLGSGATSFDIKNIGYARLIDMGEHRRDIRIELHSGAVFFRRIVNAVELDAAKELIVIDSALGVAVAPADVARISFMAFCRQDGDGVELAWFTGDVVQATTNMRAIGNDL